MKGADFSKEYSVNEYFWSIQGEGVHAGRTAVFVRLQGCPVGCHWCDSKLTWFAGGSKMSVEMIENRIKSLPSAQLLVLTGGEPLIYDLDPLIVHLRFAFPEREIHIETSGAYRFKGRQRPDWITASPKSAAAWKVDTSVASCMSELKYVVDEQFEPEIPSLHVALSGNSSIPISLMPEGAPPRTEMVDRVLELLRYHPTWRFGPRLQYAYSPISDIEGMNNSKMSASEARTQAATRVRATRAQSTSSVKR